MQKLLLFQVNELSQQIILIEVFFNKNPAVGAATSCVKAHFSCCGCRIAVHLTRTTTIRLKKTIMEPWEESGVKTAVLESIWVNLWKTELKELKVPPCDQIVLSLIMRYQILCLFFFFYSRFRTNENSISFIIRNLERSKLVNTKGILIIKGARGKLKRKQIIKKLIYPLIDLKWR